MDNEYEYNDRLKGLRDGKGKTINEMAYESGLSASTISNYERGVRIPDGKALIKLAQYFNVSTDYLLGLDNFKNKDERIDHADDFIELSNLLQQMDGDARDGITLCFYRIVDGCRISISDRKFLESYLNNVVEYGNTFLTLAIANTLLNNASKPLPKNMTFEDLANTVEGCILVMNDMAEELATIMEQKYPLEVQEQRKASRFSFRADLHELFNGTDSE